MARYALEVHFELLSHGWCGKHHSTTCQ